MSERMTLEEAQQVRLPLNPIARHFAVKQMVHDPEVVGDNVTVAIGLREAHRINRADALPEGKVIMIMQDNPFIGRRILIDVIEMANR